MPTLTKKMKVKMIGLMIMWLLRITVLALVEALVQILLPLLFKIRKGKILPRTKANKQQAPE
jgi:hypothetical protein